MNEPTKEQRELAYQIVQKWLFNPDSVSKELLTSWNNAEERISQHSRDIHLEALVESAILVGIQATCTTENPS